MRPRFSVRLFLIAFTLIAILLGGAVRVFVTVKDQVRRHKAAIANLHERKVTLEGGSVPRRPTRFQTFARCWIDEDAYSPADQCQIGFPELARIPTGQLEQTLEILKDVYGVPRISIAVEKLTVKAVKLLAHHPELLQLDIDCKSFEPGAVRELGRLKSLMALDLSCAANDELLLAARELPQLAHLSINIEGSSKNSALALKDVATLKSISLRGAASPTPYLESLATLPHLTQIEFQETPFDGEAAVSLSRMAHLQHLVMWKCQLPNQFLNSLSKLKQIETIVLSTDSTIGDNSPSSLASCLKLTALVIDGVPFTMTDLRAFHSHPALIHLTIHGMLPHSDLEQFLRKTPNCEIDVVPLAGGLFGVGSGGFSSMNGGVAYRWRDGKMQSKSLQFGAGDWK